MKGYDREKELTGKIAHGDREAMREFYDEHAGYLTAVCLRYIPSRSDVKDVLQDSFIRIFASIGNFEYRSPAALRAWTRRIVANEALKHLKKRGRLSLSGSMEDLLDDIREESPDPESVPAAVLFEMIRALPDGYRTVLNLYVFEGMSHREIASVMNIAESSSASQLHRAKSLLARQIKKYIYERSMV